MHSLLALCTLSLPMFVAALPKNVAMSVRADAASTAAMASLTAEEVHANVMANFPVAQQITLDQIPSRAQNHTSGSRLVYLVDEKAFVDLDAVTFEHDTGAIKRAENGSPQCFGYTKSRAASSWQVWDHWYPASQCLWTGLSDQGGSENLQYSFTTTITASAGLDWNIIEDVLSASLKIEVSKSETQSSTKTCNVGANSVVQVWRQQKLAQGDIRTQACTQCPGRNICQAEKDRGVASAPIHDAYQLGCSTGQKNVQC